MYKLIRVKSDIEQGGSGGTGGASDVCGVLIRDVVNYDSDGNQSNNVTCSKTFNEIVDAWLKKAIITQVFQIQGNGENEGEVYTYIVNAKVVTSSGVATEVQFEDGNYTLYPDNVIVAGSRE